MDDQFPVVLYVVYRAQVQRLGAECALVEGAALPALTGETEHKFTTLMVWWFHGNTHTQLQAAYSHIVASARKYL
jgi:hypothetical protein